MKTIHMNLSTNSITRAIEELELYKKTIIKKNEEFVKRLAEIGINTIKAEISVIPPDEAGASIVEPVYKNQGVLSGVAIRWSGNKVLFLEFSAGVTYGTKEYPLPSGDGFGATSYPGQTHASDPGGWWYKDENGNKKHSFGNRAYMPAYKADEAIRWQINEIAKEVFGGD